MALTRESVEALIALEIQVSEGPWRRYTDNGSIITDPYGIIIDEPLRFHDADFIAQSRNLMPQLARDWLRMREALEWIVEWMGEEEHDLSIWDREIYDKARQTLSAIDAGKGADAEDGGNDESSIHVPRS
ncbi:hypothetical protein [Alicyclobacillus dauci]|uniref:Uncharacterized protein n=1 Tax=Alicyclobacillus dauci TaxID=1475485 RepID=A0ABY6YWW1_9BACL|nr:hypothetical protein [Alicyclobacillus dauci]WAH35025.1 hypothetical protein NZD86_11865 [Alicyclobacillus dauci]